MDEQTWSHIPEPRGGALGDRALWPDTLLPKCRSISATKEEVVLSATVCEPLGSVVQAMRRADEGQRGYQGGR